MKLQKITEAQFWESVYCLMKEEPNLSEKMAVIKIIKQNQMGLDYEVDNYYPSYSLERIMEHMRNTVFNFAGQ